MTTKHETRIVVRDSDAATVIGDALTVLGTTLTYATTMVTEELQLAAQIAELKKTETVCAAMVQELANRRGALERRQTALVNSRFGNRY